MPGHKYVMIMADAGASTKVILDSFRLRALSHDYPMLDIFGCAAHSQGQAAFLKEITPRALIHDHPILDLLGCAAHPQARAAVVNASGRLAMI